MRLILAHGLVLLLAASANAQFAVLHTFGSTNNPASGANVDGMNPAGALIQGGSGKLYGATPYGGTNGNGIVFGANTNGSGFAVLHTFSATDFSTGTNSDGAIPAAALIQGGDGKLYGTTEYGGTNSSGTVFGVNTNGSGFVVLHSFGGASTDGINPSAGLIQGSDGRLYGTAQNGGTNGCGVMFGVNTNGSGFTILHTFGGTSTDGKNPIAGLIQGSDGKLYGMTEYGGTNDSGMAFGVNTNGSGFAVLHTFGGADSDGINPVAGLIQGGDGKLYGTTYSGGANNSGTVFSVNTNGGGFTVRHTFSFASRDGMNPSAALMQGSNGKLYGTTAYGGTNGNGIVFGVNTDGSGFAVFYAFTALNPTTNSDGANPAAGLIQGGNNKFYGTTQYGGTNGSGTAFSIFMDTTPPTAAIVSPTAGLLVSSAAFTVTGTAGDNAGVSNVSYQLNHSGWSVAPTANRWTNWTAAVTLTPGTNTLQAYAVDTSGNVSTTNNVAFVYVLNAVLTVHTNGNGTVNPNYNQALLQIGQNYSMTATAGTGFALFNWTGSQTTNGPTLMFTMASNLTFTANFANLTNPPMIIAFPNASTVVVSWPAAVTNFALQTNSNLATTNWVNFGGGLQTNGTVESLTIIPPSGWLFFRLKK